MNSGKVSLSFAFLFFASCTLESQIAVDTSGRLIPEEIEYVNKRERRTNAAIAHLLGCDAFVPGVKIPRIAFVGSGGGFRATTDYIAMLAALQVARIFDCGTYAAGLSGGAWAIFPLILRNQDPISYAHILKTRLCSKRSKEIIISKMAQMFSSYGKIKLVDTWGAIVCERLFGDIIAQETSQGHQITFDNIRAVLSQTDAFPYPICPVAIGQTRPNYDWLEINPFGIYSNCLGGSIPNATFGSIFESGKMSENKPQLPFESFMGMAGSAFCLSIGDIIYNGIKGLLDTIEVDQLLSNTIGHDPFVKFTLGINKIVDKFGIYQTRFFPAKIPNYSFHMQGSSLYDCRKLELFDAGAFINLPLPTLIRRDRGIDIYIICDASSDATDRDFTELRYAAEWARLHGEKFPTLTKFKDISRDMKIFYEDDITVPYVIYFSNQIQIATTSLEYSDEEFEKLFGFMYTTVSNGAQNIVEVIKKKLNIPNTFDILPQGKTARFTWPTCNIL